MNKVIKTKEINPFELMLYRHRNIITKTKAISGNVPMVFTAKKTGSLKNYRIYGNTQTLTRQYSGQTPLHFPITDGNVNNYRIYGNTVNGENVGDLVTDTQSENYGKYLVPIANNGTNISIYLDEPLRKVGSEYDYVDYASQKWYRVRKNLLDNTGTSTVINGLTITVNADKSITCNGTANGLTVFFVGNYLLQKDVVYKLSGCPTGGGVSTYRLDIRDLSGVTINGHADNGSGYTFSENDDTPCSCKIRIASGVTCDNLTFYPMICKASITDSTYEPYIDNTEVSVLLPSLPTQSADNVLSVNTTVSPSGIEVGVGERVSVGDKTENLGYRVPITIGNQTTNIYLSEPLAKSGNSYDYIDYVTQKRYNADGTVQDITLVELSVLQGTNTLTVGTEVQPSEILLQGKIQEI